MLPIEMIPVSELTDTELDAVCGGFFNFGNTVVQANTAVNIAAPVVLGNLIGGPSNVANIVQGIGQANWSFI